MNPFFSFLWFIYQNVRVAMNYEIIRADTRYSTLYIWAVVLLLDEPYCSSQRPCDITWLRVINHLYTSELNG